MADIYVCKRHGRSECDECALYGVQNPESALKELRGMFPNPPLKITQISEWTIAGRRVRWNIEINQFCISSLFGDIDDPGQPATLEGAMAAVRKWRRGES